MTQRYVALAHSYWIAYKSAEGDVTTFARVCWGGDAQNPATVDPAACKGIAEAILLAHEGFVSGLNSTPAPAKFAHDDTVLRTQLPMAISALKAMAAAASAGARVLVIQDMTNYVSDMVPSVLDALNEIDPTVLHT